MMLLCLGSSCASRSCRGNLTVRSLSLRSPSLDASSTLDSTTTPYVSSSTISRWPSTTWSTDRRIVWSICHAIPLRLEISNAEVALVHRPSRRTFFSSVYIYLWGRHVCPHVCRSGWQAEHRKAGFNAAHSEEEEAGAILARIYHSEKESSMSRSKHGQTCLLHTQTEVEQRLKKRTRETSHWWKNLIWTRSKILPDTQSRWKSLKRKFIAGYFLSSKGMRNSQRKHQGNSAGVEGETCSNCHPHFELRIEFWSWERSIVASVWFSIRILETPVHCKSSYGSNSPTESLNYLLEWLKRVFDLEVRLELNYTETADGFNNIREQWGPSLGAIATPTRPRMWAETQSTRWAEDGARKTAWQ